MERTTSDISALIVKGYNTPGVKESHSNFLSPSGIYKDGYIACAIGMAYIGLVGDPERAYKQYMDGMAKRFMPIIFFARELGIPDELAGKISNMHCMHEASALRIAQVISSWEIVKSEVKKPTIFQRIKAWFKKPTTAPSPHPHLRLVTNS